MKHFYLGLLCLLCVLSASSASAYHSDTEFVTADTAYTLRENEWKIGLWSVEYGAWGVLDVGTYWAPWFVNIFSLNLKYKFWSNEDWAVAARLGFVRWDLSTLSADATAIFSIIPVELLGSYRISENWRTSASLLYTQVAVEGDFESDDYQGAAAVSNLQLTSTTEWRLSQVWALYGRVNFLAYQVAKATADATFQPDEFTDVQVVGGAKTDAVDVQNAVSLVVGFSASWEIFNFRMGAGYGNYVVPAVNFVLPSKSPIVELDMYWRW